MPGILRSIWTGVRVGVAAYEMTRKGLVGREILRAEFVGGLTLVNKVEDVRLSATSAEYNDGIPVEKTDANCDGVRWNACVETHTVAEELRAYGLGLSVDQFKNWDTMVKNRIAAARVAMGENYKTRR